MELWGGHECTVNRVGDGYRDQTLLTGHHDRLSDLTRFAELGIKTLRYPVLWERVAPDRPEARDWGWSDERLAEIDRLGMKPIVGLLHHGSGPHYTSLVANDFVALFVAQAAATAQRYPHVTDWTPINEPLTTARFSALYGHWHPHARDERLFWTALLNQIDATRAAMKAIRAVNPAARLIQTEDLGQYYSTPALAPITQHFNHRRWATWDLLTGRLARGHPLWPHLGAFGLGERLAAIADDPCPPDVIGVNFYPTSERFLDDRLANYADDPPEVGYHDIAAARVMNPPAPGLAALMKLAWDRYSLPLAVTESHLGCSREEQLRWLWQSWRTCRDLVGEGVDIRAFTAWALLGNVDWNSLITIEAGHYEPGAFNVGSGTPRPTAIAGLLKTIASGEEPTTASFPSIEDPGWWQRDIRLEHPPYPSSGRAHPRSNTLSARPIVITGATGTLGRSLAGECELRGLAFLPNDRTTFPIDEEDRVAAFLDEHRPWAVINAAGLAQLDDAEAEPERRLRANSDGAAVLAQACAARDIRCTIFSSDLVCDGQRRELHLESDTPRPLGIYGESKALAQAMAIERALLDGQIFYAPADHIVSPTFTLDLVKACLDLIIDGESGIWHLANRGAASWLQVGRLTAEALGTEAGRVQPASPAQLGWRARRPAYAALGSREGLMLPQQSDAIARHAAIRRKAR